MDSLDRKKHIIELKKIKIRKCIENGTLITEELIKKFEEESVKEVEEYYDTKNVVVSRIISRQERYEVLKRQKWNCNFCGCKLKYGKSSSWDGEVAHIDHIHPFSDRINYKNGEENINESSNLQALCPKCNLSKNKKMVN